MHCSDRPMPPQPPLNLLYFCACTLQVLSDPNRRRQYDLSGGDDETKTTDYEPMDMEGIGNVG